MSRQGVLVLRRGGFGDTLLLVPLLRGLARRAPGTRLTVAGVAEFVDVLAACGACDEARSAESLGAWALAAGGAAAAAARARFAAFSAICSDQPLPGVAVPTVVVDPRSFAPGVPFGRWLAGAFGVAVDWPADAHLAPPPGAERGGAAVFAPGSGGRAKCWPRERWLALAAHALAAGGPLRVVVGPTEAEGDDPRRWSWPGPVDFVAGCTPRELAGELAGAAVFVGNDSGPAHLAALLGVPTVVLFGPSDPAVWAPVGPHVQVVVGPGAMEALPLDPVAAAFAAAYGRLPRTRRQ